MQPRAIPTDADDVDARLRAEPLALPGERIRIDWLAAGRAVIVDDDPSWPDADDAEPPATMRARRPPKAARHARPPGPPGTP